jgi:type II secretory pathway pseudopilin PulG
MESSNAPDCGRRSAITLLEVLISIGVLSVGILGAATLLPIATYYSQETSKYDRAGTLGQLAYHDMQIRGYLSPKRWIDPVGSFNFTNASVIVIDPLALTYATSQGLTTQPVFFPGIPNNAPNPPVAGAPIVFRASVDVSNNWPESAPQPVTSSQPIAMPYQMADRIFRGTDDLIFDVPGRPDQRPQTPANSLASDYSGDYSWFVTVSHTADDLFNAPNMQRLQCSLVVFYKRDINLNPADWPAPPQGTKPPPERIVFADFLQTAVNGLPFVGGGIIKLHTIPNVGDTNWLDGLKPNSYVMLSANFVDAINTTGGGIFPRIGWYRIISVDDGAQVSGGIATRQIIVDGADWAPFNDASANNVWKDADSTGVPTVFCTIAEGAVAVYDDTITLDSSLLRD